MVLTHFNPVLGFNIKPSCLFCSAKRMTGFCIKRNTGLKWVKNIINLITKNMATVHLKDAHYSVRISKYFEKFLKFQSKNELYYFTYFPNGLGSWPRKFSKSNKVPVTWKYTSKWLYNDFSQKQKLLVNVKKNILRKQCYLGSIKFF